MPESTEDKGVDALITEMQATLDKLKAAQKKDVLDESSEEDSEKTTPQERRIRVREHFRASRAAQTSSTQQ